MQFRDNAHPCRVRHEAIENLHYITNILTSIQETKAFSKLPRSASKPCCQTSSYSDLANGIKSIALEPMSKVNLFLGLSEFLQALLEYTNARANKGFHLNQRGH